MNSNAELNVIAALDLNPIKAKLMHKESGEGWSPAQVNEVEFEYRRFLQLLKLYPEEQVTPRFDVDIFWHYHILDTMKYAADCEKIFGYFLHHYPYSGHEDEDDQTNHNSKAARTQDLYAATFGKAWLPQAVTMAFCEGVALNDRSHSVRMVPRPAKMAFCEGIVKMAFRQGVAQNDGSYSVCPAPMAAKLAFCEGVAKLAFCEGITQDNRAVQVRPLLAIAA